MGGETIMRQTKRDYKWASISESSNRQEAVKNHDYPHSEWTLDIERWQHSEQINVYAKILTML